MTMKIINAHKVCLKGQSTNLRCIVYNKVLKALDVKADDMVGFWDNGDGTVMMKKIDWDQVQTK